MEIMNNYSNYAAQNVGGKRPENSKPDYLSKLQKQVKDMELKAGFGFARPKGNITHCITIHPQLLEKMQNDPQAEKEYMQRLKDIQRASNYVTGYYKAKGDVVYHNDQWYIDENGNHSHFGQTIIKDRTNERMRREAQENAEKRIEKTRENARENARKRAERLLDEKRSSAKDGVIRLYDEDIQTILKAAKEKEEEGAVSKQRTEAGANLDLQV